MPGVRWPAALLALLAAGCTGSDASKPQPEVLHCEDLSSPDGRRVLRLSVALAPVYQADNFLLLLCDREGRREELYRHADSAQFGAAWRDDRRILLLTTSEDARTAREALGASVELVRLPRREYRSILARLEPLGPFLSNLPETCSRADVRHAQPSRS